MRRRGGVGYGAFARRPSKPHGRSTRPAPASKAACPPGARRSVRSAWQGRQDLATLTSGPKNTPRAIPSAGSREKRPRSCRCRARRGFPRRLRQPDTTPAIAMVTTIAEAVRIAGSKSERPQTLDVAPHGDRGFRRSQVSTEMARPKGFEPLTPRFVVCFWPYREVLSAT